MTRGCDHCSREFRPRRFDQRFCSVWCRRDAWAIANPRAARASVTPTRRFRAPVRTDAAVDRDEASETPFNPAGVERFLAAGYAADERVAS